MKPRTDYKCIFRKTIQELGTGSNRISLPKSI